jgi:hypothetical protein
MIKKQHNKPKRWCGSDKAISATQVAFDVEQEIIQTIKQEACLRGFAPSDMIRFIVGLDVTIKPIRPRLTMTLKENDYIKLGEKYGLKPNERLAIKAHMIEEIKRYASGNK